LFTSDASHFIFIKNVAFTGGPGGSSKSDIFISGYFSSKNFLSSGLNSIVIFSELSLVFHLISSYLSGVIKLILVLI